MKGQVHICRNTENILSLIAVNNIFRLVFCICNSAVLYIVSIC